MTIKQIAANHGMSCRAIAMRFGIPRRTIGNWSAGVADPPEYVLRMIDEILSNEQHNDSNRYEPINKAGE